MVCVLLALATLAVYIPVAGYGYVNYDDADYVSANLHVQGGLKWDNLVWAFSSGHASNWHPLTWLSHTLDYQIFGEFVGGQHLMSVGLHLANTILLFLVLRRLTAAHWRAAMVAAFFALHPLHVESVAWISERKDVLSTFFLFLTIAAYGAYAQTIAPQKAATPSSAVGEPARGKAGKSSSARRAVHAGDPAQASGPHPNHRGALFYFGLALLSFALGLMSKPMLVTVPFLLLLLDAWPLDRVRFVGVRGTSKTVFALLLEKLPFFALSGISSVVTFLVQHSGGAVSTSLTVGQRVANAIISYARYIGKTLWPMRLSVLYPHPGDWPLWQVVGAAILVLVISALVIWLARQRPYLAVGWLWFVGMLVPVIGLVQVGIQSMADRYTYVPLVGLSIAVVWGLSDWSARMQWRPPALAILGVIYLLALSAFTAVQIQIWRDSEALFGHAVKVTRKNYLAYNNLGYYLSGKGRATEAMEYYRRSLEINPLYEDALNNLGYALAGQKRHAEAIPFYEAALRVRPKHAEVHNNLGNALSEVGKIDEAIEHYRFVLQEKPDHADAHNNLGIALAMQGKLDEAVPHFRDAIRYKPKYASAHSNLGNALAVQQKFDEAIREYEECLRLNPADPQAHNNLGNALAQLGKLDEAVRRYEEALRLNRDNPEAQLNLGIALARQGKRQEALAHFKEALSLRANYPEALRQIELLSGAK
jgi:protein O-mannosyl-transferase